MILYVYELEFDVRLTGLQNAEHLKGREGVIRGHDPARHGRWNIRLDDGTYVSARAGNSAHIRRRWALQAQNALI
jgi:hypothetical protein